MPVYDQVTANKRRSAVLIFFFVVLVVLVCLAFNYLLQFGIAGVFIAFAIAGGSAFLS
jgi:hypothetical protein